jgi:hypothetical protein
LALSTSATRCVSGPGFTRFADEPGIAHFDAQEWPT